MSRHTDGSMNRRGLLRAAGCAAGTWVLGKCAVARRLVLVKTGETPRIGEIEWIVYDTGLQGADDQPAERCAVRITATSGVQGWADFPGWTAPDDGTARLIRDTLLGQDLEGRGNIWRQLYQNGLSLGTLGAVDVALWDLRGRMDDKPVHGLLGTQRQKVKTYVSSGLNLGEPARYADYAVACKEMGVHGVKVRPYIEWGAGTNGPVNATFPDKDMAAYKAVREAVGRDYACMADNGGTYTFDQALRVGRLLDELGYAWYESPMPENDAWVDRYVALARELRTPICAPQTHPGSYGPRLAWIERAACDICRIDVHLGGFTACLELALACEAAGMPLELHSVGPDAYPHLQLIGATTESLIEYLEVLSLSQETHIQPGRATLEPVFDEQGYMAIPNTPGMGLELDWKYIFTHRVS
jgi:L-alanine-DL-glutamate epimerase-like enolase superfamily enzyme